MSNVALGFRVPLLVPPGQEQSHEQDVGDEKAVEADVDV